MKFQIVYRTQGGTAEIHSMACREWGWEDYGSDIVVDADHTWAAAVEAWSHDTEPEICATNFTLFFPCLAPDYVPGEPRARTKRPTRRHVPFDPDNSTDAEVIEACMGKRIKWTNAIDGSEEDARLFPDGPFYKTIRQGVVIETHPHRHTYITIAPDGERILNFIAAGVQAQFRAARLSSIVSVTAK